MPSSSHLFFVAACIAAGPAFAHDEESVLSESERVFMPEFEFGAMAYGRADIGLGFVARTSIEYRPARLSAPYLRLTYDATSAPHTQPPEDDRLGLKGTHSAHDVLLGGGYRFGTTEIQVVLGALGGLRVDALPQLIEGDALEVGATTTLGAVARVSVGAEWYIEPEYALTVEILGQRMWGPIWRDENPWAGGALLGFTASL